MSYSLSRKAHPNQELAAQEHLQANTQARSHGGAIIVVAILARIVFAAVFFHFSPVLRLLTRSYEDIAIALSLSSGHGYSSPFFTASGPTAFLAPGYPVFLALVIKMVGTGAAATMTIILIQELFSIATVWLIMYVARLHFDQETANFAGIISAIAPAMLAPPLFIWDTAFSALAVIGFLAAAASSLLPRAKFVPAGLLCGLAALVNPSLLPTLWALCGWSAWKARVLPWAGVLAFCLVYSPWPIRNVMVMHTFIPLRDSFGLELWIGNHPGGEGTFDPSMQPMSGESERHSFTEEGELAYLNGKGKLAKAYIAAHPGQFAALSLKRVWNFWTLAEEGPGLAGLSIFILAIPGLFLVVQRKKAAMLYAIPLVLFPLPYYITHVEARFQSVIAPQLAILAAYFVSSFLHWIQPRASTRA